MKRRSGKYWSPGLLKDRGWTRALMDELLPKPQWRRNNGRSVPLWHREDVQRAESTPAFRERSIGKKPTQKDVTAAQSAVERTAAALSAAWDRAERGEDLPWVLAGRYHQTILDHLPAAAGDRILRSGQVSGYLNRFLALTVQTVSVTICNDSINTCHRLIGQAEIKRSNIHGYGNPNIIGIN